MSRPILDVFPHDRFGHFPLKTKEALTELNTLLESDDNLLDNLFVRY
jgi:hypothetical protein